MKPLLLSLLLVPSLVSAQDFTSSTVDNPQSWYLVGGNGRAADVFELGAMSRNGDIVAVRSVLYLTKPEDVGHGPTDYVITRNDFDCHLPGRYRVTSEQYFASDTPDPLFETSRTDWTRDTKPTSVGMRLWNVVCGNLRDEGVFLVQEYVGKKTYTHADVLKTVRKQARDAGY